jgi:capsular polysaccharide biosynthesis protein
MDLKFIISKKQTIIVISLIFLLLATIFTLLQPVSYKAKSKLLVVQKFDKEVDSYAIARSRAYLGEILAQIVPTYAICQEVAKPEFEVNRDYFEKTPGIDNAIDEWEDAVSATSYGDSGIVEIVVKHSNAKQAENISNGILEVLSNKHARYHNGENVKLKTIDFPVIELASPNVKLNFAIAFALGLVTAFGYILVFPAPENDLNIFKKKKRAFLEIKTFKSLDR